MTRRKSKTPKSTHDEPEKLDETQVDESLEELDEEPDEYLDLDEDSDPDPDLDEDLDSAPGLPVDPAPVSSGRTIQSPTEPTGNLKEGDRWESPTGEVKVWLDGGWHVEEES